MAAPDAKILSAGSPDLACYEPMEATVEEDGDLLFWPPAVGGCSGLKREQHEEQCINSDKLKDKMHQVRLTSAKVQGAACDARASLCGRLLIAARSGHQSLAIRGLLRA